jgi:hypothetical protein
MPISWQDDDAMPTTPEQKAVARPAAMAWPAWLAEAGGGALMAALLAYFLQVSWRKWPDPVIDSGPQWYAAWRIARGGMLFHEVAWTYGPLSAYANGLLFKIFGASLTVLFAANLLIYGAILSLAYAVFRRGWGRVGAFAACGAFISVFSFSHLTSIGNYNYAAPYAHESTHGMLLILLTLPAAAAWSRGRSAPLAFGLGTCGGLAAVLKPEFMLATGVLGLAALVLRAMQREPISWQEGALLAAGAFWPTMAFTLLFAASEPFSVAFPHACNAWWRVLVHPIGVEGFAAGQRRFAGFDHPWLNGWLELKAGGGAVLVIGAVWAAGWFVNRPSFRIRIIALLILGALALSVRLEGGWFHVGLCLPLLTAAGVVLYGGRLWGQWRRTGRMEPDDVLRWLLAVLAATMLARMALFARVYHFGFFQAALAGMLAAAIMVSEVPRWTGPGRAGRGVAAAGGLLVLTLACGAIAAKSNAIRAGQTQPVGAEADRFYAFDGGIDPTGALVDWVVKGLAQVPPAATLLVLPDGLSINFLTRHLSPLPDVWTAGTEESMVERLRQAPPDYVALISLNVSEHGILHYGAPGTPGFLLLQWVHQNYTEATSWGQPFSDTRVKGASLWRRIHDPSPPN